MEKRLVEELDRVSLGLGEGRQAVPLGLEGSHHQGNFERMLLTGC